MTSIEFDLASLEISENAEVYVKHISNPDVDSLVRSILPDIREKFNPSREEYFKLLSTAKRICGDIIRKGKNNVKVSK